MLTLIIIPHYSDFARGISEKNQKFTKWSNSPSPRCRVAAAARGAEEVELLVGEADRDLAALEGLPVETGDDVGLFGGDVHDLRRVALREVRELIVLTLGVRPDEADKRAPRDLLHDEGVEHAVVHPRLGHRHEAAAVVAPVADGDERPVALHLLAVHLDLPVRADPFEEEIHKQRNDIAGLAVEQGAFAVFMYVRRDARVDARAGDCKRIAPVDLDDIHREDRPVPEIFHIAELLKVVAEVLEQVVARADGDHRHGGVVEAEDAVGDLVGRPVAAAGVKPQLAALFTELARNFRRVALLLGEDALHVQLMLLAQLLRHVIDPLAAVLLAGGGVDDKDMLHRTRPPYGFIGFLPHSLRTGNKKYRYCSMYDGKNMNKLKIPAKKRAQRRCDGS